MSAKPVAKRKHKSSFSAAAPQAGTALARFTAWTDKALSWAMGLLCLLVSVSFFTGTYDTAYVKITLFQSGAIALSALWVSLLCVQKRWPVTRKNLPWLLPFLAYYGWNFLGYALTPYPLAGFDEFLRYVLYFLLTLMVLDRFTQESARVLTKWVVLSAWVSVLYGAVQVADHWWAGVDILPWRAYFGARIFSTHANPNFFADFLVFSSFVVLAEFMRTKQKRLLVLLGLAGIDLFFTESKGAWIGFAVSAAFFTAVYVPCVPALQKHLRKLYAAAAVLFIGAAVLVGVYAFKRFQSVSFRAYTWSSAFAMVQDSPVMGTGVGSFKTIYPAYRKPQIFYIENAHNNETQHAENEFLEQWATAGTIGLALFMWLLFFVLYGAVRAVRRFAVLPAKNSAEMSPQFWWVLGYGAAYAGMIAHSFFDISIRFVSTGMFFTLFGALLVRLAMPEEETAVQTDPHTRPAWLWLGRVLLIAGLGWLVWKWLWLFGQISGNLSPKNMGDWLLKYIAWGVLCVAVFGGAWLYVRAAFYARWARVPFVLLISLWPISWAGNFLLADHYYGVAAGFSKRAMFEGALDFYQKAISRNPFVPGYRQYRAYILRQTMNLEKTFSPYKGDTDAPSTDYERALRDLNFVRKHVPNHALLHQAFGEFYYTYAVHFTKLAQAETLDFQRQDYEKKAIENMELAKQSFERSLLTDPVHEATYVYLTSIALMEKNPARAQYWIDAYARGPEGVVEEEFLQRHRHSLRLAQMQMRLRQPPFNYFPKGK